MADIGQSGLSLFAVSQNLAYPHMTTASFLQLQHSLFCLWFDKFKVLSDPEIGMHVRSIPLDLWDPAFARPVHVRFRFLQSPLHDLKHVTCHMSIYYMQEVRGSPGFE